MGRGRVGSVLMSQLNVGHSLQLFGKETSLLKYILVFVLIVILIGNEDYQKIKLMDIGFINAIQLEQAGRFLEKGSRTVCCPSRDLLG